MSPSDEKTPGYGAEQIQHLEGLEAIRKRPAMYIGSRDERGLHHLVWEVLDNSIDEALAGVCTRVELTLEPKGWVKVTDNGRGIPTDMHSKFKTRSTLDVVLTEVHAGGKFGTGAYTTSGGLHGVGIKAVNALSREVEVMTERDGWKHTAAFKSTDEKNVGKLQKPGVVKVGKSKEHGTSFRWLADERIFSTLEYDRDLILERLRQKAFLNPKLYFVFKDERNGEWFERHFCFEGGVTSFVRHLVKGKDVVHPVPLTFSRQVTDKVRVDLSLQYVDHPAEQMLAFTNSVANPEFGQHVTGFRTALTRVLNDVGRELNVMRVNDPNLEGTDVREGLVAVINLLMPGDDIQFEGQTKGRLGNAEARKWLDEATAELLKDVAARQPDIMKAILTRCRDSLLKREAMKKAADLFGRRQGVMEGVGFGKLTDCRINDPAKAELFIVEGNSAGGSAKDGRDKDIQAILPLRGKVLNVERVQLERVAANEELKSLLRAVGAKGIGAEFNPDTVRYHKIILMADADDDGAHITALLLTAFHRLMPGLIERGYLYCARPPLYRIGSATKPKYAYSDAERDKLVKEAGGKAEVARYKGLGEMNAEQLWETTMNPATRTLQKVVYSDAARLEEVVSTLMGNDTKERKHYISLHAKDVSDVEFLL